MNEEISLTQRIIKSGKPFIFFHTHEVTRELLSRAIKEKKSMDLDICIDEAGMPYLGHSRDYYNKTSEPWDRSMHLWEAVELIANADIPVIVDCKHYGAWDYVEEVIAAVGPGRCLVHSFVFEFDFNYIRHDDYYVRCEWSSVEKLKDLKTKFPAIATTASARGLPPRILMDHGYDELLRNIKKTLVSNWIDTVCLNIPGYTFSDQVLKFFLEDDVIPHIMIDKIDMGHLTELYIGETDLLESASIYTGHDIPTIRAKTPSIAVKSVMRRGRPMHREIGERLACFPLSESLFYTFGTLRYHPGYSPVRDFHLYDPEFPSAITCTPSEAELLHALVNCLHPKRPVEIGSYMGWSTAHIISALGETKLQCIEPFLETDALFNRKTCERALERFRRNMRMCGCWDCINLITLPSPDCLKEQCPEGGWDFLFLDGWHNHGQPLKDIEGALPYLNQRAVVVLHDSWVPDVRDAMLYLMYHGFSAYSLDTANFLTVCFREDPFPRWGEFYDVASEQRHRLEQAVIMRHYLGLCEMSINKVCDVFKISCRYQYIGKASDS